jgi:hypothetical protein
LIEAWASQKSFVRKDGPGLGRRSGEPDGELPGPTTEQRDGLIVSAILSQANGHAERRQPSRCWRKFGPSDVSRSVPIAATNRSSRIDARTLRHPGYAISQRKRKRIEECFGWMKTVGGMRKTRHR